MCMLAPLLKKHGFDVQVLTYFPHDFFAPLLKEANVPWSVISWKNKLGRIAAVRKALRYAKADVVIAYLEIPSLMAELASIPDRPFKLIVSERNTTMNPGFRDKLYFFFHRFADAVVPNSYSQKTVIENTAPYLKTKVRTIINCVDIEYYKPLECLSDTGRLDILVVGRFEPQKNPLGLLEAMDLIRANKPDMRFVVNWYGSNFFQHEKPTKASDLYLRLQAEIKKRSMADIFILHPPVNNLLKIYQSCSVFCLPSTYEGCSNVIAEAMACGKPILAGRVCDNINLVQEGLNGYLFDPKNPRDMAQTILKFAELATDTKRQMSIASRQRAEHLLSPQKFVDSYISLINSLKRN